MNTLSLYPYFLFGISFKIEVLYFVFDDTTFPKTFMYIRGPSRSVQNYSYDSYSNILCAEFMITMRILSEGGFVVSGKQVTLF